MGVSNRAIVNFSGGEASPRLRGRSDTVPYYACAETLENVITTQYGGAVRTSGTRHICRTKDMSKKTRLIPFIFSSGDAYHLEFGHQYIRFYTPVGSVIGGDVNITGATKANPCVITTNTATLSNGDTIDIYNVEGMTELNGRRFIVANKTSNSVELKDEDGVDVDSTGYTTYSSGGVFNRVYQISSPYGENDLANIKFTQQADIMYLTHPNYEPRKLSRFGSTNWTLTTITFDTFSWPPFLPINVTATTLTCNATTGTGKTLTASASLFTSSHVGAYFRLDHPDDKSGYVKITAVASGTSATCNVISTLGNTTATANWYEGAWSESQGYPTDCKFYEQRLYYVSTRLKPLTVWGSEPESYDNFKISDEEDSPVSYTIGSNQVDKILWAYPTSVMNLGTAGGPFTMSSGSNAEPITPTNVSVKQQNENGASSVSPVRIGPFVYYVERSGRTLGQLSYILDYDGYQTENITYLNDHILGDGVIDMALQRYPYNILWCVRNDGQVATLTRDVKNEIKGWTRQVLSGTDAKVEAVSVIPNGSEDQTAFVVSRKINNVSVRYIEFVEPFEISSQEDAFFVHSGLDYEGPATDSLAGLGHLEGEEVQILIDGAVHPNRTVENGMISLDWQGEKIIVGLGYKSTIKTMDLDAGDGNSQTKVTHISKATVRLLNSLGCKVGDGITQDIIPFRVWGDEFGNPPPLFTGDKEVSFPSGHKKNKYIVIEQEQPLPLEVLGIFPKMLISS